MIAGREEYRLAPPFYAPLRDVDSVHYRHEVLGDLEEHRVRGFLEGSAEQMRVMRKHLGRAKKLRQRYQKERWILDAVATYCVVI